MLVYIHINDKHQLYLHCIALCVPKRNIYVFTKNCMHINICIFIEFGNALLLVCPIKSKGKSDPWESSLNSIPLQTNLATVTSQVIIVLPLGSRDILDLSKNLGTILYYAREQSEKSGNANWETRRMHEWSSNMENDWILGSRSPWSPFFTTTEPRRLDQLVNPVDSESRVTPWRRCSRPSPSGV